MALIADSRPAWLWGQDGALVWQNRASRLVGAKLKKSGLKLAATFEPVKGQIQRLIRLALPSQFSAGRLQFNVDGHPFSATCASRAVTTPDGTQGLLVHMNDPVERDWLKQAWHLAPLSTELAVIPPGTSMVLINRKGRVLMHSPGLDSHRAEQLAEILHAAGDAPVRVGVKGADWRLEPFAAGPREEKLGLLSADIPAPAVPPEGPKAAAPATPDYAEAQPRIEQLIAEGSEALEPPAEPAPEPVQAPRLWSITARSIRRAPAKPEAEAAAPLPLSEGPLDQATVERVSRYNFDELSRILTDRVSTMGGHAERPSEPPATEAAPEGELVALGGETFILNRLPMGVLVFRDQAILFSNRAFADLVGYDSSESLRLAGLAAVFPAEDGAGPTTRLVKRDGTLVTVDARLNSISWQGKPALMMAVLVTDGATGAHESAVKRFAELGAEASEDGFIAADDRGVVTELSLHARILLGETDDRIVGRPLSQLVDSGDLGDLQHFLGLKARFAETPRPSVLVRVARAPADLILFAAGQAGVVSGYFGFVRKHPTPETRVAAPAGQVEDDMATLGRFSRGIRRPLNTVIGFAELIAAGPHPGGGPDEPLRVVEYARDIRTAGLEIAQLVEELDDYARLKDGRYAPQSDELDLADLLNHCLARVRAQAAEARVLVRSAVSERLPRITADRPSLTQAILNLLASAIDETKVGGTVILSAQRDEGGGVLINVRDTSDSQTELGERFVVFRDGPGKDGTERQPVRSSVGLALTRSLLAVNALRLDVDPTPGLGTIFSLYVPADLVRG